MRLLNTEGSWDTVHVNALECRDDGADIAYLVRRETGRVFVRDTRRIGSLVPVHETSTWERYSAERTWRVKPSGRALGWRPVSSTSGARCSCGWSEYASDRADARARARLHRIGNR